MNYHTDAPCSTAASPVEWAAPPTPADDGWGASGARAWAALARVLASIEAVRDGRAWYLLLTVFAAGGLLLAAAQSAFAKTHWVEASIEAGVAFFVVFYGSNAAGIWTMLRVQGATDVEVLDAVHLALLRAHRLLIMVGLLAALAAAGGAALWALLWVSKLRWIGPLVYALVVPVGVLSVGLAALAGSAVVLPLAAPAIWAGERPWAALRRLWLITRQRLVTVAVLVAAVSLITALTGVLTSFVVVLGGRVVAQLSIWITGVHVPAPLLMAGLFGHGWGSVDMRQVPPEAMQHMFAALAGGGVVFALAVVAPALVYLRGVCAVYVALSDSVAARSPEIPQV